MGSDLYLAFSDPADTVDREKFNAYDDQAVREVLAVPGFSAGRRYALRRTGGAEYPSRYRFLSIYEVDRSDDVIREGLRATSGTRMRPSWYDEVAVSSQTCELLEGAPEPTAPDQLYLVFSTPPVGMSFDAYSDWYHQHLTENVRNSPHLRAGWRYRVSGGTGSQDEVPEHFAIYALEGSAEEMLKETRAGHEKDGSPPLEGFHSFASFDSTAIGVRLTAVR